MHEFGATGLVTGYIKQLLATFELPTMRVYTEDFAKYSELNDRESPYVVESFGKLELDNEDKLLTSTNIKAVDDGFDNITGSAHLQVNEDLKIPYLKDGKVQFLLGGYYTTDNTFIQGKWQSADLDVTKPQGGVWEVYNRGAAYLNQTKTLQIRNNIYDSYTHEYLGNYLRFLRDYDGLNLMSLYNCFSNKLCSYTTGLDIKLTQAGNYGQFNVLDPEYKIYLVPVKLFQNYTIAIDSNMPVEICCGIYNNRLNDKKDAYKELLNITYFRAANTKFNQPFLYTALTDLAPKALSKFPTSGEITAHSAARKFIAKIADRESNLVLLLKVHKDVDSSIVILEGDYRGWNDFSAKLVNNESAGISRLGVEKKIKLQHNHTIIANEGIYAQVDTPLIAPLQLLRLNTKKQMPFADKLLEYLFDSCITGAQDDPRENVLMAQTLTGLHFKGESITTKYYIASKTAGTPEGVFVDGTDKIVIYADRAFCSVTGDYFIKATTGEGQILYEYSSSGLDRLIGGFSTWLNTNKIAINADGYLTKPLVVDQDLQNGVWHPVLQKLFYRYMLNNTEHSFSVHKDLLGYVDKDVEKHFVALIKDKKTGKIERKSMLNFNAWEDLD